MFTVPIWRMRLDTLTNLFGFLRVDQARETALRCSEANSFEKYSGGRTAGQEDKENFFRKGVVGDWANHFDEASLAAFNMCTGDLMQDLGYE